MRERGTYANGRGMNGHSALGHGAYGQPILGFEDSSPRHASRASLGLGSFLLTLGAGALVGHFIAKDPNKGLALGLVGGFFAHGAMEQAVELRLINEQLALLRYRSP